MDRGERSKYQRTTNVTWGTQNGESFPEEFLPNKSLENIDSSPHGRLQGAQDLSRGVTATILGLNVKAVQGKPVPLEWTDTPGGLLEWWHDPGVPLAFPVESASS